MLLQWYILPFCKLNGISYVVYCIVVLGTYGKAESNLIAGSTLEPTIQQIDIGRKLVRDIVIRALSAAYNNPERTVEYLYYVSLCTHNTFHCIRYTYDTGLETVPGKQFV